MGKQQTLNKRSLCEAGLRIRKGLRCSPFSMINVLLKRKGKFLHKHELFCSAHFLTKQPRTRPRADRKCGAHSKRSARRESAAHSLLLAARSSRHSSGTKNIGGRPPANSGPCSRKRTKVMRKRTLRWRRPRAAQTASFSFSNLSGRSRPLDILAACTRKKEETEGAG